MIVVLHEGRLGIVMMKLEWSTTLREGVSDDTGDGSREDGADEAGGTGGDGLRGLGRRADICVSLLFV